MTHKKTIMIFMFFFILFACPVSSDVITNHADKISAIGAIGRVEPRSRVIVVSHNAGAEGVNLKELFVREGDQVSKDDVLGVLADHDKRQAEVETEKANIMVLNAQLGSEKINLTYVENEYHRYQALAIKSMASQSVIDSKFLAYKQSQTKIKEILAEIAMANARVNLIKENLKNTIILAPLSGTVLRIDARPGERLNDAGLLEIADLSQLDVVAEVYETDLPQVKLGQNGEVIVPGIKEIYTAVVREIGYQVRKNDMNSTDPLADRDNRIIEVRLTLNDKAVADLQHQIYRQVQVRIKM